MRNASYPVQQLEPRRLLATLPSGFVEQTIANLADQPTSQIFAPDGRLFVALEGTNDTSGPAQVRVIKNNALLATPLLTVTTQSFFERGLLGITLHPNFSSNGHVYVYYTLPSTSVTHRVERWTVPSGTDVADPASRVTIFDISTPAGQGSAGNHNGGAMGFGPDGKLYIAVGDNAVASNSQTLGNLFGKMLRINDDGTIPADNPFLAQTTGVNQAIWALGLRNPFTFTFQPGTGRLFINDVGSSGSGRREEVNDGFAGSNYGWPNIEGFRVAQPLPSIGTYRDPVHAYSDGVAITGGAFYNPVTPMFPASFIGRYFYGDYVSGFFRTLNPAATAPLTATAFGTGASGPVDFDVSPVDGSLYYIEYASRNLKRIFVNTALLPVIQDQPDSKTVSLDEPATFEVEAAGAGLSYRWQKNNVDIPGAIGTSYTVDPPLLSDSGSVYRVIVTNASGSVASVGATLTVLNNFRPTANITAPSTGGTFVVGQTINFSGTADDAEDGVLPPSAYSWEVRYTTGAVTRPPILQTSGVTSGQFVTEVTPAHRGIDVTYEVVLTVTDSAGTMRTVVNTLTPIVSTATLATNVPGLSVKWDGTIFPANFNFDSIVGREWSIGVDSPQVVAGQTYEFLSWSDGGAVTHDITVQPTNTTYTASFLDVTNPEITGTTFDYTLPAPAAPHSVAIDFSENVGPSIAAGDLIVTNTTTNTVIDVNDIAVAYNPATNRAQFTFPGLPGGQLPRGNYSAVFASGNAEDAFGNTVRGETTVSFFVLPGDANHSRTVDLNDFTALAASFGLPGRVFSNGDFNYDGLVNLDDFTVLAVAFGDSLPAARQGRVAADDGTTNVLVAGKQSLEAKEWSAPERAAFADIFRDEHGKII
ncbi:MAG TPA: PQQ-dependent sugar dehydrogenase [Tepidisphaeraceae bacterium]|nr:PQQ-dependent sugar dehydrogenase [Tepidisphaeraceae bacterium]